MFLRYSILLREALGILKREPMVIGPSVLYTAVVIVAFSSLPLEGTNFQKLVFPIINWVVEAFMIGFILRLAYAQVLEKTEQVSQVIRWTLAHWLTLFISISAVFIVQAVLVYQLSGLETIQSIAWPQILGLAFGYFVLAVLTVFAPCFVVVDSLSGFAAIKSSVLYVFRYKGLVLYGILFLFLVKLLSLLFLAQLLLIPELGLRLFTILETVVSVWGYVFVLLMFLNLKSEGPSIRELR